MGEENECSPALSFLDRFQFGLAFCCPDLEIKFINKTAKLIIKNSSSLIITEGKLSASRTTILNQLNHCVGLLTMSNACAANKLEKPNSTFFLTPEKNEKQLFIQLTKMADQTPYPQTKSHSLFKVILCDLDSTIKICPNKLQQLYNLTTAEARILYHVASGHSLIETAKLLELSEGTVRTHMKRIFSKTNTHRQNELLHLVLTNPIWFASNLLQE